MELVKKKEFATIFVDPNNESFVIHIAFLASFNLGLEIYLFCRAQIVSLRFDEALISVSSKYTDYKDGFSKNLVGKLPEYIEIDNHAINLIKD